MCSEFLKKSQFRENILIIAPFNKIPCRNQTLESDAFQLSLGYEFETIRISLNKTQSRMKTFFFEPIFYRNFSGLSNRRKTCLLRLAE